MIASQLNRRAAAAKLYSPPQLPAGNLAGVSQFSSLCKFSSPKANIAEKLQAKGLEFFMVDDTGLEPVTLRTSSGCSYQLS